MNKIIINKHGCGIVIYHCINCNLMHETYFVTGDTHRPVLMVCNRCNSLYYYDEEYEHYLKPLSEQLIGKKCGECNESLRDTLIKYSPQKQCIKCGGKLIKDKTIKNEMRDFYEIYGDILNN